MMKRRLVAVQLIALAAAAALIAACGGSGYSGGSSGPGGVQGGGSAPSSDLRLVAQDNTFDKSSLTAAANTHITLTLNNRDEGVSHNFAIYQGKGAGDPMFRGDLDTGPGRKDYTFQTPGPGEYYFRCDVHPDTMNGAFVVR